MDIREAIGKKRVGGELSSDQISRAVLGYATGAVSEAEMAALLMAIAIRGMSDRETVDLTIAMLQSGERLDLSSVPGVKVDKHSTGGVGDKTTLVVAPLVASLGVPVPKMSGRALGHTGGTIDKLECIPGLRTELTPEEFISQLGRTGVAIAAQSQRMAPADKKIYALRDATATVESIPLIASSVMSKKLAVGADAILLDVKVGGGAFVGSVSEARKLAKAMVEIGARSGRRVTALVTGMDQPLGRAVGDAVELAEAIETLGGRGPRDFAGLCALVAGHMLALGGAAPSPRQGRTMAARALREGVGLARFRELVQAQGGDPTALDDPGLLTRGARLRPVRLEAGGYVIAIDARRIGEIAHSMGRAAGAQKALCGIILHRKVGDPVAPGEMVASLLVPGSVPAEAVERASREVVEVFRLGAVPPPRRRLLRAVVN
ncbi:MAG: thymidine phosphorylase [Armatimonadota bacterium]